MIKLINFFSSQKLVLALLLLLTLPSFITLIRPGYFFMQDDQQAFRIYEMDKCFQDFQLPCRWVPDAGYGYGYPLFNYYPPSVYYLGEVFHLFGLQFIDCVKLLFILGYLFGALTMFLLIRSVGQEFLNKEMEEENKRGEAMINFASLVGSVMFTIVPYKAVEVYVRGALNEFWSMVFFPLLFWASLRLIKTGQLKYFSFLSLSVGALLITHNLMSLIFLPLLALWCLVWFFLVREKWWENLIKLVLSGLLGVGLASFFTLPVVAEGKYAHLETLLGGYFDYRAHFVNLKALFLSNHWGYGSSGIGQDNDLSLSTGQIHWIAGLLALILALFSFKKYKKISLVILIFSILELLILFMIHQKSSFIWERLSFLAFLQFPWRFLTDSIFLLSILGSLAIMLIFLKGKIKIGIVTGVIIIISLFVLHGGFFTPKNWLSINDSDKFSGKSWQKQLTSSIFDYLPIYAKFPPVYQAPAIPEVLLGSVEVETYRRGSDFQIGNFFVQKNATLRLPLYDFPGMVVYDRTKEIPHVNNKCQGEDFCLGLITFDLNEGEHHVTAMLTNTPIRTVGNILSFLSLIIVFGILVIDKFFKNEGTSG